MKRPSPRPPIRSAAAVLALLGACGGDAAPASDTAAPGEGGVLEFPASAIQRYETSEAIAEVQDVEVLDDGRVWVLNSIAPFFVAFDASGRVRAEYGAQGGGPEDFRMPAGFVAGGLDGQAWALDLQRHALIRIDGPESGWVERRIAAHPPGTLQGGMGLLHNTVRTAEWNGSIVVPHSTGTLQDGPMALVEAILKAELSLMTPDGSQATPVVNLGTALDDPFAEFEATEGGLPLWKRLWAVCGDHLRVYDRVRQQLRGFDAAGAEVAPLDLPDRRLRSVSTDDFVQAIFPLVQAETTGGVAGRVSAEDSARMAAQAARQITSSGERLAAYLPDWVDLRCAPSGTVWAQPFGRESGGVDGGRDWVRIAPDGVRTEVRLPPGFEAFRFTDARIWGVARDALDVPTVAWIALEGS